MSISGTQKLKKTERKLVSTSPKDPDSFYAKIDYTHKYNLMDRIPYSNNMMPSQPPPPPQI